MKATLVDNKKSCALSAAEIERFFKIGWVLKPGLFSNDEVDRIRDCFDDLEVMAQRLTGSGDLCGSHFVLGEKKFGERVIKRVVWAGGSQPYLLDIGADERLTRPSAELLGSDAMEQLLSQAHFKRPHDGVVFGWHQDIQHRDKGAGSWTDVNGVGSFVQTLIAVDEMTPDSGPLMFMPASSNWGRADFGDHDYDSAPYTQRMPPSFDADSAVTILAKPGDVLFFGPYSAHASFENTSASYRRVLINGYAFPGANAREYPGDGACRRLSVTRRK